MDVKLEIPFFIPRVNDLKWLTFRKIDVSQNWYIEKYETKTSHSYIIDLWSKFFTLEESRNFSYTAPNQSGYKAIMC